MKQSQVILVVIGFILLMLMATNPSIEDHRQAVLEKMQENTSETSNSNNQNRWQRAGEQLGMAFAQGMIEKTVSRDNYLLFSLTKITFGENIKNIGFGVLGNVFFYADTNNVNTSTSRHDDENLSMPFATRNLDVDEFSNGDPIPEARSDSEWQAAGDNHEPAWCYFENDPANGEKYGKLYNWYAVTDPRGLCPTGWHVPSDAEWTSLTDNLGGEHVAGTKMKGTSGWDSGGNGNNSSGFSGLPGGYRLANGTFDYVGRFGHWWSSTEYATGYAWSRRLDVGSDRVGRYDFHKSDGMSVRCLRD